MKDTTKKAFSLLRKIKSIPFSTSYHDTPHNRIIDVMLAENNGLYFITARGKSFYKQLQANQRVAICGMDENYVSVRITGEIQFREDRKIVDKIFEHNQIMNKLYPGDKRRILEPFHLYKGKGEIFDLSAEHPIRERFSFGGETVNPPGYIITDKCTECGLCMESCPVEIISEGTPYSIDGSSCLECGLCAETCPENAIEPSN